MHDLQSMIASGSVQFDFILFLLIKKGNHNEGVGIFRYI